MSYSFRSLRNKVRPRRNLYVEDQSSMNCTLISNCGKAFLMSGLTILSTASILEKTRSNKEEDKKRLCKLTKPHFRV